MKTETIYVDSLYHCHRIDDGTMTAVETDFFIGKCDTWVEGYCYDTSKGYTRIYPWQPLTELEAAQTQYELDQEELLTDYQAELQAAYQEGVNSV